MSNINSSNDGLDAIIPTNLIDQILNDLGFAFSAVDAEPHFIGSSKPICTLRAFKDAVIEQALDEKWEFCAEKSCRTHVRLRCYLFQVCKWHARCSWDKKTEAAVVSVWTDGQADHTCWDQGGHERPLPARVPYLLELIPKLMHVDRKTPTNAIQDQILRHTEVKVRDNQLYKLRQLLTEDIRNQQINDFPKLPIWLELLHEVNHNNCSPDDEDQVYDSLVTELLTTEGGGFRRILIGPHISENQFQHSIPLVALDGTYLRNCFKQTPLLAVGRDGKNEAYIMTFAIVESENEDSWHWFAELLIKTVPQFAKPADYIKFQTPCIILDRNAGLLKAVSTLLPHVTDVYCCWHLMKNVLKISKNANKKAIKEVWWKFVYARNDLDWARAKREMQEVGGQEAVDYIEALGKSKFCD